MRCILNGKVVLPDEILMYMDAITLRLIPKEKAFGVDRMIQLNRQTLGLAMVGDKQQKESARASMREYFPKAEILD